MYHFTPSILRLYFPFHVKKKYMGSEDKVLYVIVIALWGGGGGYLGSKGFEVQDYTLN